MALIFAGVYVAVNAYILENAIDYSNGITIDVTLYITVKIISFTLKIPTVPSVSNIGLQ